MEGDQAGAWEIAALSNGVTVNPTARASAVGMNGAAATHLGESLPLSYGCCRSLGSDF